MVTSPSHRMAPIGKACRRTAMLVAMLFVGSMNAHAAFPLLDLSSFYLHYFDPYMLGPLPTDTPSYPQSQVVGGTINPVPRFYLAAQRSFYSVDSFVGILGTRANDGDIVITDPWDRQTHLLLFGSWTEPCRGPTRFNRSIIANQTWIEPTEYWDSRPCTSVSLLGSGTEYGVPLSQLVTKSTYTALAPIRRKAIDGGQYDASPLAVRRNDAAWYTHFWGYRMGLVANESNFNVADRSKFVDAWPAANFPSARNNFELTTLPPPWIEDDVVEYVNKPDFPAQPGGQFFYALAAADKATLDALPVWKRTGNTFKSGGYVSACRFYGGKNGGPNTHFYSADDKECESLKQYKFLDYEGQTFAVNVPIKAATSNASATCPAASKPLYRLYNNAAASNGKFVSNHRYVTERSDVAAAVAQGWLDEGMVMCVPQ